MTLTGMKKHVGVLERAGLVTTEKVGRVRTCKLGTRRFEEEAAWLERYRQVWDSRFNELDKVVEELERKERADGRKKRSEPTAAKNSTAAERKSERELVVTRTINGPARIVFEAFTKPELFKRWWVPKSLGLTLLSCELDVRVGGTYRLVFSHDGSEMAFFGRYNEVTPHSRLVWTNDEGGDDGAVTTVTFEERGGKTLLVMIDLYPSKEALDAAIASGSTAGGMSEQFDQLDELLVTLGASSGRS
jgi:uncharacterized protein YndB with AHSA1/START domain